MRTFLEGLWIAVVIGGFTLLVFAPAAYAFRQRGRGRLTTFLGIAGAFVWIATLWTAVAVPVIYRELGTCLPPGQLVEYVGDGIRKADCELPPR